MAAAPRAAAWEDPEAATAALQVVSRAAAVVEGGLEAMVALAALAAQLVAPAHSEEPEAAPQKGAAPNRSERC
jgi:hypothetical protein